MNIIINYTVISMKFDLHVQFICFFSIHIHSCNMELDHNINIYQKKRCFFYITRFYNLLLAMSDPNTQNNIHTNRDVKDKLMP